MKHKQFKICELDFYSYAYNGQYVISAKRYGKFTQMGTVSKLKGRYYYCIFNCFNLAFCEREDIRFDDNIIFEMNNIRTKPIFFDDKLVTRKALLEKLEEMITKSIIKININENDK